MLLRFADQQLQNKGTWNSEIWTDILQITVASWYLYNGRYLKVHI